MAHVGLQCFEHFLFGHVVQFVGFAPLVKGGALAVVPHDGHSAVVPVGLVVMNFDFHERL